MQAQPTNLYIANLATADVIIGLFAIPFQFQVTYSGCSCSCSFFLACSWHTDNLQAILLQRWNLPPFLCRSLPSY